MHNPPSSTAPSKPEQPPLPPNASAKILVVTDAANPDRFLADILKAAGYQPLVAGNDQALDRIAAEEPAVALIDLTKDAEAGLKTVRKIQMHAPGTACIVLKNNLSHQSAIQAVGLGAYLYANKPPDMEQLLLIIRRAIERQEAAEIRGEADERCRVFMDNVKLPIALFDRDGVFLSVNSAAARRLGSTPDTIAGKTLFSLCPEIAESHLAQIRRAMDSGNETEIRAETGLTTFHPIRNSKARITAVQVIEYPAAER
jgi:ActR/RegA family two-component response regulator